MDAALQHGTNRKNGSHNRRTGGTNLQSDNRTEQQEKDSKQVIPHLDLFSTSQTKRKHRERKGYDLCANNAPYFGYQIKGNVWGVVQGCCNDWNCPKCGQQRAREEYGRIVAGARELGERHKLYMLTITCEGEGLSVQDAEDSYLVWTNKMVSNLRMYSKRNCKVWAYASVTERQGRGHPHSHYLTTYCPDDAILVKKGEWKHSFTGGSAYVARHDTLQSAILEQASVRAGLGWVYDLSELKSVEGASRYVAKYLFKETIFTTIWPKGWRRVRYSQNWPKLPEVKGEAMLLLSAGDWHQLASVASTIITRDDGAKKHATRMLELTGANVL